MKLTGSLLLSLLLAIAGLSSCENYGNKVSKDFVEVYYKDGIKKEDAQQTLDLLYPSWNDSGNIKSVQLAKTGDTIYFRMVIDEQKAKGIQDEAYISLANEISSSVFDGMAVNVDLTNDAFKTIRTLHFTKVKPVDYGTKYNAGNIEVYSREGIIPEEAKALAVYLDALDGDAQSVKSFQLGKDNDIYTVFMVSDPEQSAALPEKTFYDLAAEISDNVFAGLPLTLELTDNRFKSYKTFRHKQAN